MLHSSSSLEQTHQSPLQFRLISHEECSAITWYNNELIIAHQNFIQIGNSYTHSAVILMDSYLEYLLIAESNGNLTLYHSNQLIKKVYGLHNSPLVAVKLISPYQFISSDEAANVYLCTIQKQCFCVHTYDHQRLLPKSDVYDDIDFYEDHVTLASSNQVVTLQ